MVVGCDLAFFYCTTHFNDDGIGVDSSKKTFSNMKSVNRFSSGEAHLKVGVMFLQPECNMTCQFCITENNFSAMSFSEALGILDKLKTLGASSVVIGGGEPFTWPHLIELTQEAKKRGFTVQVGTNGVAAPEGFEKIQSIDRYVLPLEAIDPAVHNNLRRYRNSHHQIIMQRLESLRAGRKSVTISTIVTEPNYFFVKSVGEFLREYIKDGGLVHAWHLYKFLPIGRGGHLHADELHVDESKYDSLVDDLKAMNLGIPIFRRKDMYHSKEVDFFWVKDGQIQRGSDS